MVCLLLGLAAGALAQHWTMNVHDYQYDMTVYMKIADVDQAGYELAAFCGGNSSDPYGSCRGVATLLTAADGTQVFRLRVRSNETGGERMRLWIYDKTAGTETMTDTFVDFEAMAVVGTPGEPVTIRLNNVKKGDANGDGVVSIADVTAIINHINKMVTGLFVEAAADVNGDKIISIADVTGVINIINKKEK
jgi:hypothetical protein